MIFLMKIMLKNMKKLNVICVLAVMSAVLSTPSHAVTLSKVNLILSLTVVELSCNVSSADVNKTVELGDWSTKQLRPPNGHSEPVHFSIKLTGCSAAGVALAFTGKKDSINNSLLALNEGSSASGVAIEIMDSAHKRLAMGDNASRVVVDNNGNATLDFSARYISTGTVVAGSANADSEFSLTYD